MQVLRKARQWLARRAGFDLPADAPDWRWCHTLWLAGFSCQGDWRALSAHAVSRLLAAYPEHARRCDWPWHRMSRLDVYRLVHERPELVAQLPALGKRAMQLEIHMADNTRVVYPQGVKHVPGTNL